MGASEEYRRRAVAYLEMARKTKRPLPCILLVQMAAIWSRLAENRGGDADEPADPSVDQSDR
jgi:hypothetical protein